MVNFESHIGAHILHTRMKLKEIDMKAADIVESSSPVIKNSKKFLRLKERKTHTSKWDHPSNFKNKDLASIDNFTKNYSSYNICVAPSKNSFHTSFDRSENYQSSKMQAPCIKEVNFKLQKYQLTSSKLCRNKNRKSLTGGISFFETMCIRHIKDLANEQTSGLGSPFRPMTTSAESLHLNSPSPTAKIRKKNRVLPALGATSFFTLVTLIFLEMILLSTVSNCAKTFYMHWNTSNSIFRIDNTDHIIDVNKGNLAFEFDQVHIICPVYEPGTFENETEKYIIYNVSKVEYETCRITNADPRVIAICDKPQKLMFFTITFRPFTPQPGGLEFLPGNDYYFISTSSKDDLYRRIGGRCSTNNMKVVFKVCCAPEEKNKTTTALSTSAIEAGVNSALDPDIPTIESHSPVNINQHQHNNINTFGVGESGVINSGININSANIHNNGIQLKPLSPGGSTGTSINTNIDQFNRIPMQTSGVNVIGHQIGVGGSLAGNNGILLSSGGNHGGINTIPGVNGGNLGSYHPAVGQYHPGQTTMGIRINNVPSQQQYPSHKHNSNNNGKEVEQQEFDRGDGGIYGVGDGKGVNIENHLPPHFLPPIIDTNHSNIVQSTMNWPLSHWSKSNRNINYNHNTNQKIQTNPNISANANHNHYQSPPHRTPSTTSTNHNMKSKNDHYDKHPNEVVKNEELTYNSNSANTIRGPLRWRKLFIWNRFYGDVKLAARSNCIEFYLKRIRFLGVNILSKLEIIIFNLFTNPVLLLTILLLTLVQCVFFMTFSSSKLKIKTSFMPCNEDLLSKKKKDTATGRQQMR